MQSLNWADKISKLKHNVLQMLHERSDGFQQTDSQLPAQIWTEGLSVFDYMFNLSEQNFINIRFHSSLITGSDILQYWHQYPPVDPETFASNIGYRFYTEDVPEAYWTSEPPAPGIPRPIGVEYKGKIINGDICRYQSCISNLYSMGILESLLESDNRNLIVEIGGGYGGLAHQLGNILAPNSTYIIVDLPEILLFSGGYLIVNNPEKNIYIYEKDTFTPEFLTGEIYNYDYVLLPNYVLEELYAVTDINLIVNMQSFQEMSEKQVTEYVRFACSRLSGYLYSDNIDVHPFNGDLAPETVTTLLARDFRLFPPPEFYEEVIGSTSPWFYKHYFGVGKDKDLLFPEGATMKFMSGCVRYSLVNSKNGVRAKKEKVLLGYFITLGLKVLQVVFRM